MTEEKKDALGRPSSEKVQVPDVANVRALAKDLLDSGLFPGVKNVAGAVTVIQAGLELGIPPVAALNTMAIINGRLTLEAKALLAIAQNRAGVSWRVTREDEKGCEIIFSRPGWPDAASTFTEDESKAAGLLSKANWKTWPKDMYFARAASRGIRRIAPDAVLGLYSKEEMTDATPLNGPAVATEVKPAEVHSPAPVKDEWTDMSGTVPVGKPYGETGPSGEDGPEADPLAEAHQPKDGNKTIKLVLSDGKARMFTKAEALKKFAKVKQVLGEDDYAEILQLGKYADATQIPDHSLPLMYSMLIGRVQENQKYSEGKEEEK